MSKAAVKKGRLMVVDDEPAQVRALAELLTDEGYEVAGFTDAVKAIGALADGRFDVLLTDLQMPAMDGLALMEQALRLDADLVPLLMTGHGTVEAAVAAMKRGATDFVLKPFRLRALRPVLQRAMEIRRLRLNSRALAARLAERSAELEAANRELDAFAARAAHDLQGPVQNMIGFARLLKESPVPADPQEVALLVDRIVAAGARADALIRDLLQFARLGNGPLSMEPVPLARLVRQAREALLESGAGAGARAQWRVGELPTVNADASLLLQAVFNLLSNALKYSAPCEQPVIEVGAEPLKDGGHRISVADNGVGFDTAHAHRLFSPFERLHGLSEFPGTGMGLANVKRIVERHGGTVAAASTPGHGARFSFTLPG